MSLFGISKLLEKIYDVIPSAVKPSLIKGMRQQWRDDFNGTALSSDWEVARTGSGQVISVGSSELNIATGTFISSTIIRNKKAFSAPCKVGFLFKISQRILNQQFYFEVIDKTGTHYARLLFDGTAFGTCIIQSANDNFSLVAENISMGISSTNYGIVEIEINIDEIKFATKSINSSSNGRNQSFTRHQRIPDPNLSYFIQIRALNTALVPSNTNFTLDSITLQESEIITAEIISARGSKTQNEAIPVIFTGIPSVSISSGNTNVTGNNVYTPEFLTPLSASVDVIGTARDATNRSLVIVTVQTDQPGDLWIDQSPDGTTWLDYGARPCVSGINTFTQVLGLRWFRVRYTNGNTAQTIFRLYSYARSI